MASMDQLSALKQCFEAATASGHIYPAMAACEAMVESAWMTSELATQYRNIFGLKSCLHEKFGEINLPTREFTRGKWVEIDADFVVYPCLADSFSDRMDTLRRLAPEYSNYDIALRATTPQAYVIAVSLTWSTDPNRAKTCIAIFNAHQAVFA